MPETATAPDAVAPGAQDGAVTAPGPGGDTDIGYPGGRAVRQQVILLTVVPAALTLAVGAVVAALLARSLAEWGGLDTSAVVTLVVGGVIGCAVLATAGILAARTAQVGRARDSRLSALAAQAQRELKEARERLDALPPAPAHGQTPAPRPAPGHDPERATASAQKPDRASAPAPETDPSPVTTGSLTGREAQVEVFVNLARRLQSLVHREIGLLDELENQVEDPDLLKGLFRVDHLATRVRRYAENLAVLGGAASHRQWTRPVRVSDVLRSAVAEIEHYARVKLVPPIDGTLRGDAVADLVHLLAELAENATVFSSPQTRVLLRAERVTSGLAIEIEDRGLGMNADERRAMNALLATPDDVTLDDLLRDGRIGLYVVAALARRHGIRVQLQGNIYGGTQAVLVLPPDVLGRSDPDDEPTAGSPGQHTTAPDALETGASTVATAPPSPGDVHTPAEPAAPTSRGDITVPAGDRPALPQRRRSAHQEPEHTTAPRSAAAPPLEDVEHDPSLMAAFRSGVRLAEGAEETTPEASAASEQAAKSHDIGHLPAPE